MPVCHRRSLDPQSQPRQAVLSGCGPTQGAFVALVAAAAAFVVPIGTAAAGTAHRDATSRPARTMAAAGGTGEFVVVYADRVAAADARAAIAAAGGTVVDEIGALGIARVITDNAGFSDALTASGTAKGVVRNQSVGNNTKGVAHRFAEERALEDRATYAAKVGAGGAAAASSPNKSGPETFSSLQWNMAMIGATPNLAHATATGDGVTVGIIDTGIDGTHPDLAPNFNAALSRNFTTDIPDIDGPCEAEPDQSCEDPATVDEGGHGTHVAGIVAAAANGIGVAGVAPDAPWSTCEPARTRDSSSSSRPLRPSPMRPTTTSTSST